MKSDSIHAPGSFPLMTGKSKEARAQPLLRYRLASVLVSLCLHGALLLMPWHVTRDARKDELPLVVMLAKDMQAVQHIRQDAANMGADVASPVNPLEPAPAEPAQASADESSQGQLQEESSQSLPAPPAESSQSAMELHARGLSDGAEIASRSQTKGQNVFRAPRSSLVSAGGIDPLKSRALGMQHTLQLQAGTQPEAMPQSASPVQTMVLETGVAIDMEKNLTDIESRAQPVSTGGQSAATTAELPSGQGALQPLLRGEAVLPIKARLIPPIPPSQAANHERRAPIASTQAIASEALISDGAPAVAPAASPTVSASGDTGKSVSAAAGEDATVALSLPAGEAAAFNHAPQSSTATATVEVQQAPAATVEEAPSLAGNLPCSET
ncbi:MAG: hypothetical protein QHH01_06775, partial [Spirochaetales bacterium]|nr:hypothetical protein [Spirochaetales bacterium]